MKKILIVSLAFVITSCVGILSKKDVFIGDWVQVESIIGGKQNNTKIKISKEDVFYKVVFFVDGKDMFKEFGKDWGDKNLIEQYHKYQLSPDKRFLISIIDPSGAFSILTYNEDNNTIQCGFGWFKKE